MTSRFLLFIASAVLLTPGTAAELDQAKDLYQRTNYPAALKILLKIEPKDAATWSLIGQSYFFEADYKKATEAFEKAIVAEPDNSEYIHWLGRTFGRRAETSTPLMALGHAAKTRQLFERAVLLNPRNGEAVNDLFDYYLNAPGFLGGGSSKAQQLLGKIEALDPAEGQYARAQLAEKQKDYAKAEQYFRRAIELAPKQVGRFIDLAKFLATMGRVSESDAAFQQAMSIAPSEPKVLYSRAETLIKTKRNLEEAKRLLQQYVVSSLSPDDPPREKAAQLLKQLGA